MNNSMNLCRYLRGKYSQHLEVHDPATESQQKSTSGYFVCIKTMTVSGPDHQPVSREDCHAGRQCFLK